MIQYKCIRCNKVFRKKIDYNRHINRKIPCISKDEDRFQCSVCCKTFASKGSLKRHWLSSCAPETNTQICTGNDGDQKNDSIESQTVFAPKFNNSAFINDEFRKNRCNLVQNSENIDSDDEVDIDSDEAPFRCNPVQEPISTEPNEEADIQINENDKVLKCENCKKQFTRPSSLKRHLESRCNVIKEANKKKELVDEFIKQFGVGPATLHLMQTKILTDENIVIPYVQNLPNMPNTSSSSEVALGNKNNQLVNLNNNTTNKTNMNCNNKIGTINNNDNSNTITNNKNSNNQTVNIQVVAYGKEDKSCLTNNDILRIVKKGFNSVPELMRVLHFDENKPENHNLYISNMRDKFIMTFDGEKWGVVDRTEALRNMFDDGRNFLANRVERLREILKEEQLKQLIKFDRFDNDIDEYPEKKEEIINELKMMLYNKRDIPLKTKKIIAERQKNTTLQ